MFSNNYPPLLNTPNPKATSKEELFALYDSPYLGAITSRTSMLEGFAHDDTIHKYTFFDALSGKYAVVNNTGELASSLNTLGYSPIPLATYLQYLQEIHCASQYKDKLMIISVAGNSVEIRDSYALIVQCQQATGMNMAMEINLSCPNIPDKIPPAYAKSELLEYFNVLLDSFAEFTLPIGLKLPPYTYHEQFLDLIKALQFINSSVKSRPIRFLTSTNTIGNSLLLDVDKFEPVLGPVALGGMAGANLHPLALGNVYTLRKLLNEYALGDIFLIGVGGVRDLAGYYRMRKAGADMVGIASAMLARGLEVFKEIAQGLEDN